MATRVHDLLEHPELQQGLLECRDRSWLGAQARGHRTGRGHPPGQPAARHPGRAVAGQRDRLVSWFYSDLPNTIAVVVTTSLQVSAVILVEAGLGFLGLGDRTVVSWGDISMQRKPVIRVPSLDFRHFGGGVAMS